MADTPGMAFLEPIAEGEQMAQRAGAEQRAQQQAPAQLSYLQALGRYETAEAAKLEADAAGEKNAAALLAQRMGENEKLGKPQNISDILRLQGQTYLDVGLPDKAAKLFEGASQAAAHESTARAAAYTADSRILDAHIKEADEATKLFSGVHDQASANAMIGIYEQNTGHPWPGPRDYKEMGPILAGLKARSMSAYQKAELERKDLDLKFRKQEESDRQVDRAIKNRMREREVETSEAAEARRTKESGSAKSAPIPGKTVIDDVVSRLSQNPRIAGKGFSDEQIKALATDVATGAADLRRTRPQMSPISAQNEVLNGILNSGALHPEEKRTFGANKPATYSPPILLKPGTPISQLKDGYPYTDGNGGIFLWDAATKSWQDVPNKTAGLTMSGGAGSDTDTDTDTDEDED